MQKIWAAITIFFIGFGINFSLFAQSIDNEIQNEFSANDSAQFFALLNLSEQYLNISIDSADFFVEKAKTMIQNVDSFYWYQPYISRKIVIKEYVGSYDEVLNLYFEELLFLESNNKFNNDEKQQHIAVIHNDIGLIYFKINKIEQALKHINIAKDIVEKLKNANSAFYKLNSNLGIINNLGAIYMQLKEFDKAEEAFLEGISLNELLKNERINVVLLNNLGIINMEKSNFEKSISYYHQSLYLSKQMNDTISIIQLFNNLGLFYRKTGNNETALLYLDSAYNYSKGRNNILSQGITLDLLTTINAEKEDFKKAYFYHVELKALSDSIFNDEQIQNITRLEIQYEYEKRKREADLLQQKELLVKEKKIILLSSIMGVAVLLLIIIGLFTILQRNKMRLNLLKQKQMTLESENLKLAKESLEKELDHKNKELTTNVMYLLRKNEFIQNIAEKLIQFKERLKRENQDLLQKIVVEMHENTDTKLWEDFELRFQQVHKEFYEKLNDKFPDLTPNERKLCAFLKLNMSTKEISAITFQSPNSIIVARSRLRKKIGIERDENLVIFLQQF